MGEVAIGLRNLLKVMERGARYRELAHGIAAYLAPRLGPTGEFPGPDHYGRSFARLLWSHWAEEFAAPAASVQQSLLVAPPRDHGEFNAYAWLHTLARGKPPPLCLAGRHSANWMLLRAACRALPGPWYSPTRARLEARAALLRYGREGFLYDRAGVRSLTYHAFSGALLVDLWQALGTPWLATEAVQAAGLLAHFVLPNGDALYLGRGQEQIFGYGAALYLLEAAAAMTGEPQFAECADRVLGYVRRFRREDGSFPLVLDADEPPEPWDPAARPGWYGYNRYADYLPFLGVYLVKAAETGALPRAPSVSVAPPAWCTILRKARYTAVLTAPWGAASNGLAFPSVSVDGESLFPCYGGEGVTRPEALPLPYARENDGTTFSFRDRLRYRLEGTTLIGESPALRHVRRFTFEEDGFACEDTIVFRRPATHAELVVANFLFRNLRAQPDGHTTTHGPATAHLHLPNAQIVPEAAVTASGVLSALRQTRPNFHAAAGEELAVRLRVSMVD